MPNKNDLNYRGSGVDTHAAASGLARLGVHIKKTLSLRDGAGFGRPIRGLGYYANVLDVGNDLGIAVSTDGVGTKLLVAEILGKYDTVGIDCVAMNVNDLICVGAEPMALLDYIAVGRIDHEVFEAVGKGLYEACRQCSITIPGGEIAQIGEMLKGEGATSGFDLVGTAVGTVPISKAMFGQHVVPGDVVIGIASSGLHSNGFTLARKVLAPNRRDYERHEPEFGRTIGEELLEPTALYVGLAVELFKAGIPLHAVCHITGDGYMNLTRVEAKVGFVLDGFPDSMAVFRLIEERGRLTKAEMFEVFNMGIGLCLIAPNDSVQRIREAATRHGFRSHLLGHVTNEAGVVRLPQHNLVGKQGKFEVDEGRARA